MEKLNELENIIIKYLNKIDKKLNYADLRKKLEIQGQDELTSFNLALKDLEEKGILTKNKYEEFIVNESPNIGIITIDKYGVGHVKTPQKKYKINNEDLNGALDQDTVLIENGKVKQITKRNKPHTFLYLGNNKFVSYGERTKVYVTLDDKQTKDLQENYLVSLTISTDKKNNTYKGTLLKVCGHRDDPTADINAIAFNHGFNNDFPKSIEKELKQIPDEVQEKDKKGRVDLTKETTFTIDGIDTKDMDDAVSIKKDNNTYTLKVHIADVPYYIKSAPNTYEEALQRGTSAYFANYVIPMFPHKISNGICSLNEGKDRLTKTVEIQIDKEGNILKSDIYNSVINSKKKMNYDDVNKILEENKTPEGYEKFKEDLLIMEELSEILEKKRKHQGFLEFNDEEIKVKTNEEGKTKDIKILTQRKAEKLIENFMIEANIVVAKTYGYLGYNFIFRVHEAPDNDALERIINTLKTNKNIDEKIIKNLEKQIKHSTATGEKIKPKQIQVLLNSIRQTKDFPVLSDLILKAMKRAHYSTENLGHFGISEEDYTHFTSPIRRSTDLLVHTYIDKVSDYYEGKIKEEELIEFIDKFDEQCKHINEREREEDKAEKEVNELKLVEYFKENQANIPTIGTISDITRKNIIVKIDKKFKVYIDLNKLGYQYLEQSNTYKKGNQIITLGGQVNLYNIEVDLENKMIKAYNIEPVKRKNNAKRKVKTRRRN